MKSLLFLISIYVFPVQLWAQEKGIRFDQSSSWAQIKAKALAENKYIFVDCYTTWCGPCKMMEHNIYPNDTVAGFVNDHFVSLKVQIDSTANDNAYVKSWYNDRRSLNKQYKIEAYPTFLFLTPQGELVMQDIGYKDVKPFMEVLKQATDPKRKLLYDDIKSYKAGNKHYADMANLSLFAATVIKDTALASQIAKDYIAHYLDTVHSATISTKVNFDFAYHYYNLVHPDDALFNVIYNNQQKVDEMEYPGWAEYMVNFWLTRDVLTNDFIKDGKPVYENPDWKGYEARLQLKYPKMDAHKLMLGFEAVYYLRNVKDWEKWADLVEEKNKTYPFKKNDSITAYTNLSLNASMVFERCSSKPLLLRAITWVDEAIKIDGDYMRSANLGIKANLLYKLDKKEDALQLAQEAVASAPDYQKKSFTMLYDKMKKGEKTWKGN